MNDDEVQTGQPKRIGQLSGYLQNLNNREGAANANSEWTWLVGYFFEKLEPEWDARRFKPLTLERVATELSRFYRRGGVNTVNALKKDCDEAKCGFSRAFWAEVKRSKAKV
jgi:hypothetical protein